MRFFDVENSLDYYSFGILMPERNGGGDYRYSFNGMEKDDEVKGKGNSYTTTFRQYDARLGRWLSLDPLMSKFPWQSPYVSFNNRPTITIAPKGKSGIVIIDKKNKTITIKSTNYYFSRGKPNEEQQKIAMQHAKNLEDTWNATNATQTIDGVEYKVQFEVKGKAIGGFRGRLGYFIKNNIIKKGKKNFIKVGSVYSTNSAVGGRVQDMTFADFFDTEKKTDSHEQGHLWGWFDEEGYKKNKPKRDAGYHNYKRNKDGTPNIMQDRNKLPPEEYKKKKSNPKGYR